jgi:hypothetical protein
VVGAGEISPAQPTQSDEAFLRTNAHSMRGPVEAASGNIRPTSRFSKKQQTEAALRGKVFVPRSEMNEADVALMRQRQAMARQVSRVRNEASAGTDAIAAVLVPAAGGALQRYTHVARAALRRSPPLVALLCGGGPSGLTPESCG